MLLASLLVAHIAVLGYWLGAELVINHTYRYVCWSGDMPFPERARLMDHVMDVDQHVRYAMAFQFGLGTALAALLGYVPGGKSTALAAGLLALAWLGLIEAVHRTRRRPGGPALGSLDRGIRYALVATLLGLALAAAQGSINLPAWLAWKLAFLAGAVACGLGIRWALVHFFAVFGQARSGEPSVEPRIRGAYFRATGVLALLWVFLAAIVAVSVLKPG